MAEPTTDVPEGATNRTPERPREGEAALRAVLEEYGGDYADAAEYADEVGDVVETAVLVLASADDDEVEHVTDSMVSLVRAADAVSTEGTVTLAEGVGENADDLADALDTVLALQREGHLDALVDLAGTLADLDVDGTTVDGLNRLLDAVGEAEREAPPSGPLELLGGLRDGDVLAGLGYVLDVLKALGRRR